MHLCIFCNIRSGTDTSWKQEISCRPPIFLRKQRMSPDWPGKRKVKQASNHLFFFKGHVKFDVTNISLFESPSVITPGGCIRIILHTEIFLSHVFVGCGPLPASDHEDYSMFQDRGSQAKPSCTTMASWQRQCPIPKPRREEWDWNIYLHLHSCKLT